MSRAVVLVNLGTPSAPTPAAVRQFLRPFLSDRRVVEVPTPLWLPILYGIILPFRSPRVARAYAGLWKEWGDSPLRLITQRQRDALQAHFNQQDEAVLVEAAMTYGGPSLSSVVDRLYKNGAEHILVLPLYPQYSATTTAAVIDQLAAFTGSVRDIPSINVVKNYHNHPLYIEALAQSVEEHWRQHGRAERLLLSYHGIPRRNVDLGDPYEQQCRETSERLAARLQLMPDQWSISYQSRLGRAEWLQPYTSETLQGLGASGMASVDVMCPAFAADCLETLEEIEVENREIFERSGGGEYRYIPCLNDRAQHIELLAALVKQYLPRCSEPVRSFEVVKTH